MSSTRLYNDKNKIIMDNKFDYDSCNYILNVPGNGLRPSFIKDPYVRMQKFGGNISSNIIDVNSNLIGLDRKIGRDCTQNEYNNNIYSAYNFPEIKETITRQPRAENPAWELRDQEKNHWDYPLKDPQNHIESPFDNNVSSRILEKDNYMSKLMACQEQEKEEQQKEEQQEQQKEQHQQQMNM